MWNVTGTNLQMAEGDYGLKLPVTITGPTFSSHDYVKIVFKTAPNADEILAKDFNEIADNTVDLELTEAESALFPVGSYCYRLDWYQSGAFMCNIIPISSFKVVDKA